jgi:hypothetical protein
MVRGHSFYFSVRSIQDLFYIVTRLTALVCSDLPWCLHYLDFWPACIWPGLIWVCTHAGQQSTIVEQLASWICPAFTFCVRTRTSPALDISFAYNLPQFAYSGLPNIAEPQPSWPLESPPNPTLLYQLQCHFYIPFYYQTVH